MRAPASFDLSADVCVVGGGVAGLSVAGELARRGRSVVLVEASRLGWNSGPTMGIVSPGYASSLRRIAERVGMTQATALWSLSLWGLRRLRAQLDQAQVGVEPGWLRVYRAPDRDAFAARLALLRDRFGLAVEDWPDERVRAALHAPRYGAGLYFPDAFSVHPAALLAALVAQAASAGVRLFEATPAVEIDAAGIRKRVVTPSATIRSAQIVLAGNTHLGAAMPRLSETLVRLWGHAAVLSAPEPALAEAITVPFAVSDGGIGGNHYRRIGEGRLAWSGHVSARAMTDRAIAAQIRRDAKRIYPALRGAEAREVVRGELGLPIHLMPQIGEITPGLWVASGFGGHGLNIAALAGELVASGIIEQDDRWKLFAPFELAWAGGALGRIAAASVVAWRRTQEAMRRPAPRLMRRNARA